MPPSAAAVVVLDDDVHIRPLAEYRHALRPRLTLVGAGSDRRHTTAPQVAEVRRLLTAVLEVLDGRRPIGQLSEILADRSRQRTLLAAARATDPGPRILKSLHLSRTSADAVDLCARVDHGRRSRAMTGRLERHDGRWQFTMLAMI